MGGGHGEHAPRKDALENKEKHDFKDPFESDYGTHDTWDMRTPFGPFAWAKVRCPLRAAYPRLPPPTSRQPPPPTPSPRANSIGW